MRAFPAGAFFLLLSISGPAAAGFFSLPWGMEAEYKLTTAYSLALRIGDPSRVLTDGEIDPLVPVVLPGPGRLVGFERTGLSTTMNFDDGNRNFDRFEPIYNRLSALLEMTVTKDNFAIVVSGSAFYDDVYHSRTGNRSADTLNRFDGDPKEFSDSARSRNGRRARLLEAYAVADFGFGDFSFVNIRVGNQLVAWGESLFFGGMASVQGPADATKAFVPGAEIKDILLPTNQVAVRIGLGRKWTLLGQYRFSFEESEIFPVGDFFSPSDIVGPGAEFAFGSINPAFLDGCPGLLDVGQFNEVVGNLLGPLSDLSGLCNQGGLGGVLLNADPNIIVNREKDIRPSDSGQWGVGVNYSVTTATSVGLHYLRYHSPNPTVQLNTGFARIGEIAGVEITTGLINQAVPVTYQIRYFDDIEMISGTFSTVLGKVNVAGELNYRDGTDISVLTIASGVPTPISQRGKTAQVLLSGLFAANPKFIYDDIALVGEMGFIHVLDVEKLRDPQDGIIPQGDGDALFFDRNSFGFQVLAMPRRRNVLPGWDLTNTFSYSEISAGNPSQAGAFSALFGEGDRRLSIGASMQYLQNLDIGIAYNLFFGNENKLISDSFVRANPFVDRDYLTLNVKYAF